MNSDSVLWPSDALQHYMYKPTKFVVLFCILLLCHCSVQFFERGSFGNVRKARWNGKEVAVKVFRSTDQRGGFGEEVGGGD